MELRVLAIDDDKDHVEYMRSILLQFNFYVRVYPSPQSALNFLKDHAEDVDFLLVAVNMEEMSGFQFLDIAAKIHRNIQALLEDKARLNDVTDSSGSHNVAEVESMNNGTSKMQASTGSNTTAQSIVNYPDSGNDETLWSGCEGDELSKASTSPRN
ncbi:hypothetical protein EJB05_37204, partial [Eragrostis curvula]